MPAFKDDKTKTWKAVFYYTNYKGERSQTTKRGFKTKKDAQEYEREFLLKSTFNLGMTFQSLYDLYIEDMQPRLREHTLLTKKKIIEKKILPFFKDMTLESITAVRVRAWQNTLLNGVTRHNNPYSQTYIRTICNQLTAIFNYAVRFHSMRENPCHRAGTIGKKRAEEKNIWTPEEFEKFVALIEHKIPSYTAFQILFWTGLRIGELLALSIKDIDFENKAIVVNKSYQRLGSRDVITAPKTEKGKRTVDISDELLEIIEKYLKRLYKPKKTDRLFPYTKHIFENDMKEYAVKAGVKKIRLHDLRHSHASFLFNNGIDIMTIALRLGHEEVQTTLETYTHLYKKANIELRNLLNKKKK